MTSPAAKAAAKVATKVADASKQMVVTEQRPPGSDELKILYPTRHLPIDSQQVHGANRYGPPQLGVFC